MKMCKIYFINIFYNLLNINEHDCKYMLNFMYNHELLDIVACVGLKETTIIIYKKKKQDGYRKYYI